MAKRPPQSQHMPTRHTIIIGDVQSAWEKMYWDVEIFLDIQRSYPEEDQPLVYAALNACISAWTLEQWAEQLWKQHLKSAKKRKPAKNEFQKLLSKKITVHGLCADVANTTKHAAHREDRWPDGMLTLKWDEGGEYNPPGLMLLRSNDDRATLLHSDFFDLPKHWWSFLREEGLVSGDQPTPTWWQNKISRMFGNVTSALTTEKPH